MLQKVPDSSTQVHKINSKKMSEMMQFSVIIPTRNRPESLAMCLESFTALEYPAGAWELIVVNDGGINSFSKITEELYDKIPLQLVDMGHAGPAAARNKGAGLAGGEHLAFTDDDCRVEPDWLSKFAAGFRDDKWDALGGCSLNPFPDNMATRAWHFVIDFLFDYFQDVNGNAVLLLSNNVAYRRSVYEHLGGFDEIFPFAGGEDNDISYRLLYRGFRQCYYPDAKIWHHQQLTWWGHIQQQFRYGRGGFYFQNAKNKFHQQQPVRLRSSKSFCAALVHSMWQARIPISLSILISIAQIAYHAGKLYEKAIFE